MFPIYYNEDQTRCPIFLGTEFFYFAAEYIYFPTRYASTTKRCLTGTFLSSASQITSPFLLFEEN